MDRGAWGSTVHGVAKSQMQLSDLTIHNNNNISWKDKGMLRLWGLDAEAQQCQGRLVCYM